jgi:tetratricopeptide (TPR) repeat protein
MVMFLTGRVATDDGTLLPSNVMVERVCNARIRQQVYANSHGDFSMQLGSMADSFVDATADGVSQLGQANRIAGMGIPRRDLANCELRASVSGFHSSILSLVDLSEFGSSVDVGAIVIDRLAKIDGKALSAALYKVPKDARSAYQKGLEAEKNGKLSEASQDFEKAVKIYPKYASAWFRLGTVLQKQNENDAARVAYTQAVKVDNKFLPPYLSLSFLACEAQDWTEVLNLTGHILAQDPLNYAHVPGYILDLDPLDYAEAYFYNSLANYKLDRIADAEKSGLKAEHLDVRPRFPQLHLLLADIFTRKNDYETAISELQTYLDIVPQAKNADQVRAQVAQLEKLNDSEPNHKATDPM